MERRNKEYVRFRYGICLNESCPKGQSKEVQEIAARKDFVCAECGKPLRECPPPKKDNKTPMIIAALAVVVAIVAAIFIFSGGDDTPQPTEQHLAVNDSASQLKTDSVEVKVEEPALKPVKVEEPAVEPVKKDEPKVEKTAAPKTSPTASSSKSKNLGYAIFKGSLKNGQPNDVNGRLIFKTSHVIDSRDPKGRVAEAGDYIIGEFSEGHLVQGIWYGSDNTVKGSIIIGK